MQEKRLHRITLALVFWATILIYPQLTAAQSAECLQKCEDNCFARKNNEDITGYAYGIVQNCEASCLEACAEFPDDNPQFSAQLKRELGLPGDLVGRTTGEGSRVCGPGACICTGPGDCINLILACQGTDEYRTVIKCDYDSAGLPESCTCLLIAR